MRIFNSRRHKTTSQSILQNERSKWNTMFIYVLNYNWTFSIIPHLPFLKKQEHYRFSLSGWDRTLSLRRNTRVSSTGCTGPVSEHLLALAPGLDTVRCSSWHLLEAMRVLVLGHHGFFEAHPRECLPGKILVDLLGDIGWSLWILVDLGKHRLNLVLFDDYGSVLMILINHGWSWFILINIG